MRWRRRLLSIRMDRIRPRRATKPRAVLGLATAVAVLSTAAFAGPWDDCNQDTDWGSAIQGCTAVIEKSAGDRKKAAVAYYNRGNAYSLKGDRDGAIADFTRALELDARAEIYHARGDVFIERNDYDQGIADYTKALALAPKSGNLIIQRAVAYNLKGEPDLAIRDLSRAIDLDGEEAMLSAEGRVAAHSQRGLAYTAKGQNDRAIADFTKAIELDPKQAAIYSARGEVYSVKRDHDRAIADFSQAIELDPRNADLFNRRGDSYRGKGELDRAILDYNNAIQVAPAHAAAYNSRGLAHWEKDEPERAIADYAKAIELDPRNGEYVRSLGLARYSQGDFQGAAAVLSRAGDLDDDIYAALFRYLARVRGGEKTATLELGAQARRMKVREWPRAIAELYLGKRSPAATLNAATKPEDRCEAEFYIGQWHILKSNPAKAARSLQAAVDACPKAFTEYAVAVAELKRLKR
jgi:tetratricopeptide (TPR) repeat protein